MAAWISRIVAARSGCSLKARMFSKQLRGNELHFTLVRPVSRTGAGAGGSLRVLAAFDGKAEDVFVGEIETILRVQDDFRISARQVHDGDADPVRFARRQVHSQ